MKICSLTQPMSATTSRRNCARWPKRHSAIVDVRGKGLMIAAELDSADLAKLTVAEMLKRHISSTAPATRRLRFLPPYILERAHVDTAIAALDEIFTEHAPAQPQPCSPLRRRTNHG
jgi:4-aminobutyrate aminotransferase-like enzyme